MEHQRTPTFFAVVVLGAVLGVFLIAASYGVIDSLALSARAQWKGAWKSLIMAFVLIVAYVVWLNSEWGQTAAWERVRLVLLAAIALALGFHFALTFDTVPFGDSQRLEEKAELAISAGVWNYLVQYIHYVRGLPPDDVGDIWSQRALLSLVPLYWISGTSVYGIFTYKLFNLALHILTGSLAYLYVYTVFKDKRAAFLTASFYLLAPNYYIFFNLPSHDVPGAFYLAATFCTHAFLQRSLEERRHAISLGCSVLMGILLVAVHLQREIGIFVWMAILTQTAIIAFDKSVLARPRASALPDMLRLALLMLVIPWIIYQAGLDNLCGRCGMGEANRWLFWFNDTSRSGVFTSAREYLPEVHVLELNGEMGTYAIARLGSELYHDPSGFGRMMLAKLRKLGLVGDHARRAIVTESGKSVRLLQIVESWRVFGHIHRVMLWAFGAMGLYFVLIRDSPQRPWVVPVLFWFAFTGGLMFGQVVTWYSYPNYFTLSVLAGLGCANLGPLFREDRVHIRRPLRYIAVSAFAVVLCASVSGPAFAYLWPRSEYFLRDLHSSQVLSGDPWLCQKGNKLICRLVLGGDFGRDRSASWMFPAPKNQFVRVQGLLRKQGVGPEVQVRLALNEESIPNHGDGDAIGMEESSVILFTQDTRSKESGEVAVNVMLSGGSAEVRQSGEIRLEFVRVYSLEKSEGG